MQSLLLRHRTGLLVALALPLLFAIVTPRPASARLARKHVPHEREKTRPKRTIPMAITVDDLPGGGPEVGEFTHLRIVTDIVEQLRAHHVEHATGFIVGSMLDGHPDRQAALDAWVDAGYEVGNHTFSHRSLDESGLDAYMTDIAQNDPVLEPLERRTGQHERYFRYPYLGEGRSDAERKQLSRFLSLRHYVLARVSVDFSDWAYAPAYGRCIQHGDDEALELLKQSYLENASAYLAWSIAAANQVLGHAIGHVLLLHANVATAQNLDALLTAYEGAGVRFISLDEALSDPVYMGDYDVSGTDVLSQAAREFKRPVPPRLVRPLSLLDLACK